MLSFDFENHSLFNLEDFNNDDHVDAKEAEKYSIIIDSIFQKN